MEQDINKLIQYIEVLDEWNEKFNLVSYKTIKELIINHIIDSLSLKEILNSQNLIIGDVGTGPGLPGIVLSIILPLNKYNLIEPKKKYYRFLKKVIIRLNLKNIDLINNKIENIKKLNTYNIILNRAVGGIDYYFKEENINKSLLLIFYQGIKVLNELVSENYEKVKIIFIKKIKILEKYNKHHYIIALRKRE